MVTCCQVSFGFVLIAAVRYHTSLKWAAEGESGVNVYPPKMIILLVAVSRTAECPSLGAGPLELHCAEQMLLNSRSEIPRANEEHKKLMFFFINDPLD